MSSTIFLPPRAQLCIRYCSTKQQQGTISLSPRSLVGDGQTSSHRPRLVVSGSTCPPSSPPPREQLCNRYCSNKHTHRTTQFWVAGLAYQEPPLCRHYEEVTLYNNISYLGTLPTQPRPFSYQVKGVIHCWNVIVTQPIRLVLFQACGIR